MEKRVKQNNKIKTDFELELEQELELEDLGFAKFLKASLNPKEDASTAEVNSFQKRLYAQLKSDSQKSKGLSYGILAGFGLSFSVLAITLVLVVNNLTGGFSLPGLLQSTPRATERSALVAEKSDLAAKPETDNSAETSTANDSSLAAGGTQPTNFDLDSEESFDEAFTEIDKLLAELSPSTDFSEDYFSTQTTDLL